MPVRYSDLPPHVKARIDATGRADKAPGSSRQRADHSDWRCAGCGVVFTQWAPAARHSAAGCSGRHRLDLVLESEG
jgi:hypothetical protein